MKRYSKTALGKLWWKYLKPHWSTPIKSPWNLWGFCVNYEDCRLRSRQSKVERILHSLTGRRFLICPDGEFNGLCKKSICKSVRHCCIGIRNIAIRVLHFPRYENDSKMIQSIIKEYFASNQNFKQTPIQCFCKFYKMVTPIGRHLILIFLILAITVWILVLHKSHIYITGKYILPYTFPEWKVFFVILSRFQLWCAKWPTTNECLSLSYKHKNIVLNYKSWFMPAKRNIILRLYTYLYFSLYSIKKDLYSLQ